MGYQYKRILERQLCVNSNCELAKFCEHFLFCTKRRTFVDWCILFVNDWTTFTVISQYNVYQNGIPQNIPSIDSDCHTNNDHGLLYPTAVYTACGFPRCIWAAPLLRPVLSYFINIITYHHIYKRKKNSTRGSGYRDP